MKQDGEDINEDKARPKPINHWYVVLTVAVAWQGRISRKMFGFAEECVEREQSKPALVFQASGMGTVISVIFI